MAPRARIPNQLKDGPFSVAEASAAGVSYTALQGTSWRRIGRGLYRWAGAPDDTWKLLSAYQRLWPQTIFSGGSAAWLHGLDVDPVRPIEVVAPCDAEVRSRPGVTVHHANLCDADITTARALRTTTAVRAFRDLSRALSRVERLVVADAAVRLGLGQFDELAEPAESPMETRLRWLLIESGLARPQVQAELRNSEGELLGRADLFYPEARLVIEFDGGNHRDRLVEDNRRQNRLIGAGYRLLRFTASDVYNRPEGVVAQVSAEVGASSRRPAMARH